MIFPFQCYLCPLYLLISHVSQYDESPDIYRGGRDDDNNRSYLFSSTGLYLSPSRRGTRNIRYRILYKDRSGT